MIFTLFRMILSRRNPTAQASPRHRFRPRLESLESRHLPSTFTVTNLLDDGSAGSLRWAIGQANSASAPATIDFNLPGANMINLLSALPALSQSVTISGPGAANLTVQRSTAPGTQPFRIFDIEAAINVSVSGLTLANGEVMHDFISAGSCIFNKIGTVTLTGCTVSGNTDPTTNNGGAISNDGILTVSNCTFSGNDNIGGGAIGNGFVSSNARLTVIDCTFSGNTSPDGGPGGAIANLGGTLTVTKSTFLGNTATSGGAIYNVGTLVVHNSTFSGNTATYGGAIYNIADPIINGSGQANVVNCTLSGNTASDGGGIDDDASNGPALLKLANTIVASNQALNAPDIAGTVTSEGHNLIGNPSGASGLVGSDFLQINPRLVPLADNGGPTMTMALRRGSVAVDAGSNALAVDSSGNPLSVDQRGLTRIVNGTVDIGAYEFQGAPSPAPDPFNAYVTTVYQTVLNRTSTAAEVTPWMEFLETGGTRAEMVKGFWESAEHRGIQVDDYYRSFLKRAPSSAERLGWVSAMLAGMTEIQVVRAFVTSAEYRSVFFTSQNIIDDLFGTILGRPISSADPNWYAYLDNGGSIGQAVDALLGSGEYSIHAVDSVYFNLLGRLPTAAEALAWANFLTAGGTHDQVAEAFLASDEFFANAQG
jgi:predicted outer membrane repeat protein